MGVIRTLFWLIVAAVLVTVGLANRGIVTLRALPEALAGLVGLSPDIDLPLFVVIFLGVALGLLIGFLWEWLREYAQRAEAARMARQIEALKREVASLRSEGKPDADDVLTLLEKPAARRAGAR